MLFSIEIFLIVSLGLVLGSFSSALVYRVPRGSKWGAVRSACVKCKTKLSVLDLIPVFSWLLFRGKCHYCGTKISRIYPLLEGVCALLSFAVYMRFGFNVEAFILIAAIPFLIALLSIDIKYMILPNQLVFIVMIIGLVRLFYFSVNDVFFRAGDLFIPYFFGSIIYACVPLLLGFILTKVLRKDSLGMGDVKFFFVAGLWLGLDMLPYFMMFSGGGAIIFALYWRYKFSQEIFPFGPALILSFYSLLLFQGAFLV